MSNESEKRTNWELAESALAKTDATAAPSDSGEMVVPSNRDLPPAPNLQVGISESDESPKGVLARFHQNRLSRKASIAALKSHYDNQLDALRYTLAKACQVSKARADALAEKHLKELDAGHLEVLGQLGLRNKDTRERTLIELTDSTVEKLKEVQSKDWPPSLIEETIQQLFEVRKRAVAEIMNELGDVAPE
ncbi:MAG: hypothetical protein AAF497_10880 [Planctomycetota bacterium]